MCVVFYLYSVRFAAFLINYMDWKTLVSLADCSAGYEHRRLRSELIQ